MLCRPCCAAHAVVHRLPHSRGAFLRRIFCVAGGVAGATLHNGSVCTAGTRAAASLRAAAAQVACAHLLHPLPPRKLAVQRA